MVWCCNSTYRLRYWNTIRSLIGLLSFTGCNSTYRSRYAQKGARRQKSKATMKSAHLKYLSNAKVKRGWLGNSTYRSRYWNYNLITILLPSLCCNSTYRLRYAPKGARRQRSKATMRPTHFKHLSKAKVKRRWLGNSTYRLWHTQKGAIRQTFLFTKNEWIF